MIIRRNYHRWQSTNSEFFYRTRRRSVPQENGGKNSNSVPVRGHGWSLTLAALMSSSARHSAMVLTDLKAESREPETEEKSSMKRTSSCWSIRTRADQVESLVDASKRWNIDSLSSDCTSTTNTGRIFTWSTVDDSVNQHLKWVLDREEMPDQWGSTKLELSVLRPLTDGWFRMCVVRYAQPSISCRCCVRGTSASRRDVQQWDMRPFESV